MDLQSDADNEQLKNNNSTTEIRLDENKLNSYLEKLKLEQNLPMGILAGLAASFIGAFLWAAITVITEYQIGFMAIGVGFIVGFSVRYMGKGLDPIYGIIGAFFALLGCLMGNFFSIIGFAANDMGMGYFETLNYLDYSAIPEVMIESFSAMDILFYGIAVYEGYKFALDPSPKKK